jgi:hypothetical protein
MKRTIFEILVVMMALSVGIAFAQDYVGNGAPKAPKAYSLNIIGVPGDKNPDMSNSGHRIFVPLNGTAKIELIEGADFAVLDANGTDGPAQFQLPDPGLDPYVVGGDMTGVDTISDYSVFVRPLGPPGGWATITTCADLLDSSFGGLLPGSFVKALNRAGAFGGYASVEQVGQDITLRQKGKSIFQNVTAQLLTIVFKVEVDTTGDGITDLTVYVRVPIFDPIIENEYWEYDNSGLKILQVRFYEVGTDVSLNDSALP